MVNSYGLPECLDWVERESGWKARKGKLPNGNGMRKGLGMACSHYISGASKPVNWTGEPHATVKLKLDFDGSIVVLTGAADIGQGSSTILVQSVAEVLGLDLVAHPHRHRRQRGGAEGQRLLFLARHLHGRQRRDRCGATISRPCWSPPRRASSKPSPDEIECLGELYRAGAQDKGLTFDEVVTEALKDTGTITVTGNYSTIPESHGGKKYRGAAIGGTMGYSYSAQVVEVSVDEETGVVTVDKVWVAHDCGKALNRLTVEGQVQGSVWMGMGQAMSEEAAYHDGLMLTANMLDYRVPTIQDSPPIEVGIVESNDPHGPFGAKEAGEGSLAAFLPALTNAIADATAALQRSAGDARPRVRGDREARSARARKTQRRRPDGRAARIRAAAPDDARRADRRARGASGQPPARRRHRSGGQHPARHRRAAGADRHQRRGGAARASRPTRTALEIGAAVTLAELAAHPGVVRALSGGGAGGRRISPARPIATWARSAAISASTPAASSTIRANGGATPTIIA